MVHVSIAAATTVGIALIALASAPRTSVRETSRSPAAVAPPSSGREPIKPIPLTMDVDARKVDLGQRLFHDPRLSRDDTISCASCHHLDEGGDDNRPTSIGIGGMKLDRNAPTVWNSAFNFKQFWDGRSNTLADQAGMPILAVKEMGSTWAAVVDKVGAHPEYDRDFRAIYADGVTPANIRDAIAEFERSLTTPNCRFDRFLRGERGAITEEEQRGYRAFKDYGCVSCHQGVNVGGNMFETLGAVLEFVNPDGRAPDLGRFNITGVESDKYVFKVPGLRNVALTAPYFHDGSVATLDEAVRIMAHHQLGRPIDPEDVRLIVLFLHTLTGDLPAVKR